jgi:hypothetical protein
VTYFNIILKDSKHFKNTYLQRLVSREELNTSSAAALLRKRGLHINCSLSSKAFFSELYFFCSLFHDTFSLIRLYSVYDSVISVA